MDEHTLFLRRNEKEWTCSFCKNKFSKGNDYFNCHLCNFYLCTICFERYEEIICDIIEEVDIGFETKYYGQSITNFLL